MASGTMTDEVALQIHNDVYNLLLNNNYQKADKIAQQLTGSTDKKVIENKKREIRRAIEACILRRLTNLTIYSLSSKGLFISNEENEIDAKHSENEDISRGKALLKKGLTKRTLRRNSLKRRVVNDGFHN